MSGRVTARTRIAFAGGICAALAVLAAPAAGGQSGTVLWQGPTPEDRSGVVAVVGKPLRIVLEAVGTGEEVRIRVSPKPAGAVLTEAGTAPARAVFAWTPRRSQLGDRTLVFTARSGAATATRLRVYVHVSRRAGATFRLSNRRLNGRSYNAVLLRPVEARARPTEGARVVGRLRTNTPEHVPHVLYLSQGRIDPRTGTYWVRVPLPILPNGSMGWIPRTAVGELRAVDTHLVIERARFRATLYRHGRPVFRSIVGVGEPRWPTPAGRFYIRERLTGFTDPIYGSLAFGTNARSAVLTDWPGGGFIGIHGTNQPEILPGRVSHGCVRLPNPAIRRLDRMMRIGTPVTIR
jgi:lipoprotein-anchoring transpeptidase ErfK/SrfK